MIRLEMGSSKLVSVSVKSFGLLWEIILKFQYCTYWYQAQVPGMVQLKVLGWGIITVSGASQKKGGKKRGDAQGWKTPSI
jgi:hypothetical protein